MDIVNYVDEEGISSNIEVILTFFLIIGKNKTEIPLELVICGNDNFNYSNKDEMILKGINTMLCVKEYDKTKFTLRSTFFASHYN